MRRFFLFILLSIFIFTPLIALPSHHPDAPIYALVESLKIKGLIERPLPDLRPYPLHVLVDILEEAYAISGSDEIYAKECKEIAEALSELSAGTFFHPTVELGSRLLLNEERFMAELVPTVGGNFFLKENLSASADFTPLFSTGTVGTALSIPGFYSRYKGMVDDAAEVGGLNIIQDWNSLATFGSPSFYFQSGFNRSSVGPFIDDGVVISPFGPHAGNFSLYFQRGAFSFTALHLALIGENILGEGYFTNKHLDYRSYTVQIHPKLSFGFFESVMYGDRLELMYLVPFSFLFNMQGLTGWSTSSDNSFIGLRGEWRPISTLAFMGELYVDDFPFNSFIRFDFNARYKLAGELGLVWTPISSPLSSLKFDYTAVLPYMYTHSNKFRKDLHLYDDEPEGPSALEQAIEKTGHYSRYTHFGESLGTSLLPNSERYSLRARFSLPFNFLLRTSLALERHGNASEDFIGPDENGLFHYGDLLDNGYIDEYTGNEKSLANTWRFLNQRVIEVKVQFGLGADTSISLFTLSQRSIFLKVSADYIFEYIWNASTGGGPVLGNNIPYHYAAFSATFKW